MGRGLQWALGGQAWTLAGQSHLFVCCQLTYSLSFPQSKGFSIQPSPSGHSDGGVRYPCASSLAAQWDILAPSHGGPCPGRGAAVSSPRQPWLEVETLATTP